MKTGSGVHHPLWVAAILCIATALPSSADELEKKRAELEQWVMNYYLHPDPEHFVERVQSMSKAGILHDSRPNARPDANVMFLGKIMAANPKKIREWLDRLSSLPAQEMTVLKRAAWYSRTAEGAAWLEEHGEAALAKGPPPMLLADQPFMRMEPHHLDQLWEWFFATGDEKPMGRIVSLFSLAHEPPRKDSLNLLPPPVKPKPKGSAPKSEEGKAKEGEKVTPKSGIQHRVLDEESLHRIRMYNYRILKPALWSCTSMAIQRDRVLEILKGIERKHYHAGIKAWLGQIIKIAETERAKRKKN